MRNLISIVIVLNIIYLNIGLSINSHYCGGKLSNSSISLFQLGIGCGMEDNNTKCDTFPLMNSIKSIPCCFDLLEIVNIEIDYLFKKLSNLNFTFKLIYTITPNKIVITELHWSNRASFDSHPPPKYNSEYRIFNQVFII